MSSREPCSIIATALALAWSACHQLLCSRVWVTTRCTNGTAALKGCNLPVSENVLKLSMSLASAQVLLPKKTGELLGQWGSPFAKRFS